MGEVVDNGIHAYAEPDLRQDYRPIPSHGVGVPLHHIQVSADGTGKVGFINHQQVGLRNAGTALAGNLIPAGNVDDVNGVVGQLPAEVGGEVIAAGLQQKQFGIESAMEFFQGQQIGGYVLANGRVGTATGLDGANAFGRQRLVANEEFGVFLCKNIIRNRTHVHSSTQLLAQCEHQRGFATPHWPADANGESASGKVARERRRALGEGSGVTEVLVGVAARAVSVREGAHLL
jgi:hypothetical protein